MGIVSIERVRELLEYNPETGIFTWKADRTRGAKKGANAGSVNKEGYVIISVDGTSYKASRLAVLLMTGKWPEIFVDHENLNRSDNRWVNIRNANKSQNVCNSPLRSDNSTGYKGVYAYGDRFRARIRVDGRLKCLGIHATAEDAHRAYAVAAKKAFGDFARPAKAA